MTGWTGSLDERAVSKIDIAISAIRAARAQEQAEQEPVGLKFPRDTTSWTGGWTIDYKTIRSVDDAIEGNEFKPCIESVEQVLLALEKVYAAPQPVKSLSAQDLNDLEVETKWAGDSHEFDRIVNAVVAKIKPVRTKDLTDQEIDHICARLWSGAWRKTAHRQFARAVIAAYKEKNSA